MLNNEFTIVGIAISNFTTIPSENYSKFLKVEVEVLSNKSQVFEMDIQFYNSNTRIDFNERVIGHNVMVNGFISTKNGNMRLVGVTLLTLDRKKRKMKYETMVVGKGKQVGK